VNETVIGLLHPGEMGAAVGRCLTGRGYTVLWASARSATAKGWRWIAEMEEIGASMAAAGLPDGFHQAAAEIFRRVPRASAAVPGDQSVEEAVLAALCGP